MSAYPPPRALLFMLLSYALFFGACALVAWWIDTVYRG